MRLARFLAALTMLAALPTLLRAQETPAPAPAPAAAPKTYPAPRPWAFTLLGGYGQYSNSLKFPVFPIADGPLVGLRLERRLTPGLGIELAGSYGMTEEDRTDGGSPENVTSLTGSGSLIAHFPRNKWGEFYLAGGGGYNQYDSDQASENLHYGSFEAAAGFVAPLGDKAGLRFEVRNILNVPHDGFAKASNSDQQYWVGLQMGFGGPPKDTDGDGVQDKKDKCPDTPKGAQVNETGCPTDADGDGVFDGLDQCIGTPKGARVDEKGCPVDGDADGVYDGIDQCDGTPKGATVDARGCPSDADGDGVFDGIDTCPNTPQGAVVNATGCPADADGDGVPDGIDRCPGTAAGLAVDSQGCPIEITEKETELLDTGMIRLQNVNFETGKSVLLADSHPALDEVGTILLKWPALEIEIGGHTDSRGSEGLNQRLSEARAQAVKTYLVEKFPGLNAAQIQTRGYGEAKPVAKNTSALNMAKNRRVEFKVTNRDVLKKEVERRKMLEKK